MAVQGELSKLHCFADNGDVSPEMWEKYLSASL